ncbi:ATPase [Methanobrevibacter filiformis]|uniref:Uncharacterized protein n=1 Tax=Methanobrevibacter filiformis TaxID=55758 RepID=A0A166EWD2_9EURY|nr:ATPase [Methanobrevibacter filiformis]KZX17084.1 hypothetical protein MBFIL_03660 [Methanobrevibacter filiformis]
MNYTQKKIENHVRKIRKEIGHEDSEINIKNIIFNENISENKNTKNISNNRNDNSELWIITKDRSDKSIIIGKGGWVVGRLKEELGIGKIHVESYSDYILKKYKMELSLDKVNSFIRDQKEIAIKEGLEWNSDKSNGLINLKNLLEEKINNIYNFDFNKFINNLEISEFNKENKHQCIVALSGGVDSSFSLIIAKYLNFNPIAITVDPGTIILPKQFKNNINKLCNKLNVKHKFIKVDYSDVIDGSLSKGKFHPCGQCSSKTGETLFKYGLDNKIPIVIFGDMLSTGSQCITKNRTFDTENNVKNLYRLNLPATLAISKQEIKQVTSNYDLTKIGGFGCPLLFEVHKKYPYMRKFSIQRILRETRSGALEPGEALDLIWSFNKVKHY